MAKKIWKILKYILPVLGIAAAVAIILLQPQELTETEAAAELEQGTFLKGVSIEGIDLSGKTYAEGEKLLREREKQMLSEIGIDLVYGEEIIRLNAAELRAETDAEAVLKEAFFLGKSGSNLQKHRVRRAVEKGVGYHISYALGGVDRTRIDALCEELRKEPVNARMEFSAAENFTYREEKDGSEVDREKLTRLLDRAVSEKDLSPIEVPVRAVPAEITMEELRAKTVLRAKYATSFAESPYNAPNRVTNIKKSVKLFNESDKSVLAPGEKLSLNAVLGDRTEAGGWKPAPGYVSGRTEDQPGGGVCQISTTLYGAALKADLEIVERSNHSIPVGYVKQGLDATISTGGPDLVIKNNTKGNLYLRAWISAEEKLYFEIYGLPFEGFDKITLSAKKLREIKPEGEMKITVDESMTADEEEIIVKRRNGSEWETFKSYHSDGHCVKTVSAGKSHYKAFAGEKKVGTN